nr:dehydrogenase/reductase SDR family member 11-like [Nerophis lumbriciformis]
MERWRGRVALVTGASVGIGAAIAKELVKFGMTVVGCARDFEKLKAVAAECRSEGHSGVLVPFKCDLTSEEEIASMFSAIKAQHEGVDVCINNAGVVHAEPLLSGRTTGWKNMLDVNVLALSICTQEAYQSMKDRNVDDGHIININGMSGHHILGNPDLHFYCATKFAVTALTEALRRELREANSHIRTSCISPGRVDTEFVLRLYSGDTEKISGKYKPLDTKDVADAVTYVLSAPPHVQVGDVQMRPVEQT